MNYFIFILLAVSGATFAQTSLGDLFDRFDSVFEEQQEMMNKMMKSGFVSSSISKVPQIQISSKVLVIKEKTFEVVTIETSQNVSTLDIKVGKQISVQTTTLEETSGSSGSYSSRSSSSQTFPIPKGGEYRAGMGKQGAKRKELYFEVKKGKIAQEWGSPDSLFGGNIQQLREELLNKMKGIKSRSLDRQDNDDSDREVILPQKKI